MNLSDLLTHLEWLAGGIAATAVVAFGAVFWVWSDGKTQLEKAVQGVKTDYKGDDETIRADVVGLRNQVTAFQTGMYTKDDGGALESRLVTRIDRIEDKIDDRMDRLDGKVDQLMRNWK